MRRRFHFRTTEVEKVRYFNSFAQDFNSFAVVFEDNF